MNIIRKYTAPPATGRHVIKTKKNAILLKAAGQYTLIAFWFQENTDEEETEEHVFMFLYTGGVFTTHDLLYFDTALTYNGDVVTHIYICIKN